MNSRAFVTKSTTVRRCRAAGFAASVNSANTLAQVGQRVLLMEADLRCPKVSDNLRPESAVGLTTVLVGRIGQDAVQDQRRKMHDVVIVNAPPLLPVTDAALLTAQSDGALVVVRHSKTTRDQLRHATERLEAVDGRTLGVVLNMVPQRRARGYGDGYGYGYGYEYAPEQGRHGQTKPNTEEKSSESALEKIGFKRS